MPLFDRPPIDAISVSDALFSSGTFRITGGPGITVASDASGASLQAFGTGGASYYDNMVPQGVSNSVLVSQAVVPNTLLVQPLDPANEAFPGIMTVSTMMMQFSMSHNSTSTLSTSVSSSHSSTVMLGIYSRVNATQLSLINSAASSWAKAAASSNANVYNGLRWLTFHSSQFSSQPVFSNVRYYFGVLVKTSNFSNTVSMIGQYHMGNVQRSGTINVNTATNASMQHFPMMGIHSSSQTNLPSTIAMSAIVATHPLSPLVPSLAFNNLTSSF